MKAAMRLKKPSATSAPPTSSMMPAAMSMGGRGPWPMGAGKLTIFISPCSRNSRPTTMRVTPRICGENFFRKSMTLSFRSCCCERRLAGIDRAGYRAAQVIFQGSCAMRRQQHLGVIAGIEYHAITGGQAQEELPPVHLDHVVGHVARLTRFGGEDHHQRCALLVHQ